MPSLNWIGKKDIKNHHNHIEYRVIDCQETVGEPDSGNLIVKGDNLLALKALLPYYAGEVKLIYIDPPYNTGNTKWVYSDNIDSPVIKKWLEKTVDSNDLSRSDKWLCMIYPRFKLLYELLKEDGAIFVSIDDDEVGNLRQVLDEIFGANNFVANIIWEKKFSPQNDAKWFSDSHDHILCYAKNKNKWFPNLLDRSEEANARYKNPDSDPRGLWTSGDISVKTYSAKNDYPITTPSGRIVNPPASYCWRFSEKKLQELIEDNCISFGKEGDSVPRFKRFLSEVKDGITQKTIWYRSEVGDNQAAKKEVKEILPERIFDTPKPIRLIERIIKTATEPHENHIIMDSFAGSGTTGHAVLSQNRKDGGNRKFILIEMEEYAKDITTERMRRVVLGYEYSGIIKTPLIEPIKITASKLLNMKFMTELNEEAARLIQSTGEEYEKIEKVFIDNTLSINGIKSVKERMRGLGGGFQYCELSEPLLDDFGLLSEHVTFDMLAKHIYFTEFGIALTKNQISKENNYAGKFKETALFIYFEKKFNLTELNKILEKNSEKYLIFADTWSISPELLAQHNIEVKQLPLEIRGA